ncbi:thrombospondin-1-like [Ruditapes philippinarum]|uniref:thrombospondin-1-like n=1 Tax=Ruditapes philippinarum TaxID=129788 RepID=UPI00295B0581|nr:thrombospondin-1-like [Ruditapes philippinarum]
MSLNAVQTKACVDDESVDCARLNSIFSICSDVAHAKSVCAKFCGLCMVDGNWTLWSTWSKCDVTCENGHQTRTRTCTHPAQKNGGLNCVGDGIMTKVCKKEQPCPVHGGWSDWSNWGTCSVTCGMGLQRRTRTCSNPPPILAGNHCFGDRSETQLCMPSPCANGGWSDWTSWSSCSATCGGGIRTQTRSCSNPSPSPYGQSCVGSNDRVESCANNNCGMTFD